MNLLSDITIDTHYTTLATYTCDADIVSKDLIYIYHKYCNMDIRLLEDIVFYTLTSGPQMTLNYMGDLPEQVDLEMSDLNNLISLIRSVIVNKITKAPLLFTNPLDYDVLDGFYLEDEISLIEDTFLSICNHGVSLIFIIRTKKLKTRN